MTSNRISENSCDEIKSIKQLLITTLLLKIRGFDNNVTYIPSQFKRQTRKRQIIWFNPLYSVNVKTLVKFF